MKKLFYLSIFFFLITNLLAENKLKIKVPNFLTIKPVQIVKPVFYNDENVENKKFDISSLNKFKFKEIKKIKPYPEKKISFFHNQIRKWYITTELEFQNNKNKNELSYIVFYIKSNKFSKPQISINTNNIFTAYFDNKEVLSKNSEGNDTTLSQNSTTLDIETGYHKMVIKTIKTENFQKEWKFDIYFETSDSTLELSFFTTPEETYSLDKIIGYTKVSRLQLSPDGSKLALFINNIDLDNNKTHRYIQIYSTKTKKLLFNSQNIGSISSFQWYPDSKSFSFIKNTDDGNMILLYHLDNKTIDTVLHPTKKLENYYWAKDGKKLIYSISEQIKEEDKDFTKYENMESRWPWWKNRSFLYLLTYPDKSSMRLTYGKISTNFNCFNKTGDKIIFSRSFVDLQNRPYSKKRYYLLNLKNFNIDTLFTSYWANAAIFLPDDSKILVLGGPSSFGKIGINLPDSLTPNDYDTQAFLFDLKTKQAKSLTYNFNPSIRNVFCNNNKTIYFLTEDRTFSKIYKYDISKKKFTEIKTKVDIVSNLDIDNKNSIGAFIGNGAYDYPKVFLINLTNGKSNLFKDFEEETYKYVKKGKVENWDFINKDGIKIEGFVYYPPNFDSTKKYPCIVYYYGGTSPVGRNFGGRYPKEYYAANGYIVYVLEPRGATGYGQLFSAYHVNDWGTRAATDVIEGTKKFLKSHKFVDPERVGCMGASFGGFLTMNILTKTDIFAAAISHAGISSISSYWGEGYWGYLYSAVATANSFPWNRKDIYVDKSPLFNADKIKTPLLLLHGDSDTNVPVGESIQMYTALKLLGKNVEMIHVKGEDHWILDYKKRIKWTKTILAWFDKYLKKQPEWWNSLYKN